jgi:hypothetical protein
MNTELVGDAGLACGSYGWRWTLLAPMATNHVPRLSWPQERSVFDAIVARGEPVVFLDALAGSPAMRWTPALFAQRQGQLRFNVLRNPGRMMEAIDWPEMSLAEFVSRMSTEPLYLLAQPILDLVPELRAECRTPSHLEGRRLQPPRLNLGGKLHGSPLHFDIAHNLYVQIHGRRWVHLAAPSDADGMYHPSILTSPSGWTMSPVDVEAPDYRRFPKFAGVTVHSTILEPGEMLFIPSFHRHAFTSLGDTLSLSFFWEHDLLQTGLRALLRALGRFSL